MPSLKGTVTAQSWLVVAMQGYRPYVARSSDFSRESRMLQEISYFLKMLVIKTFKNSVVKKIILDLKELTV